MKIITINYPRYLDDVRLGDRYYHFACGDDVRQGQLALINTDAGYVCVIVEAIAPYEPITGGMPIALVVPRMAAMQDEPLLL